MVWWPVAVPVLRNEIGVGKMSAQELWKHLRCSVSVQRRCVSTRQDGGGKASLHTTWRRRGEVTVGSVVSTMIITTSLGVLSMLTTWFRAAGTAGALEIAAAGVVTDATAADEVEMGMTRMAVETMVTVAVVTATDGKQLLEGW